MLSMLPSYDNMEVSYSRTVHLRNSTLFFLHQGIWKSVLPVGAFLLTGDSLGMTGSMPHICRVNPVKKAQFL